VAPLMLAGRLADVERTNPERGKIDEDSVHDMRVAARRLRAALRLVGGADLEKDERRVKRLQDALGDVRDRHVQIEWLESHARSGGAGTRAFLDSERKMLAVYEEKLERALDEWSRDAGPRLAAHLGRARVRGRLGGGRMEKVLGEAVARVDEGVAALDSRLEPRAVHELRIEVKKLRYMAELLRPGFPEAVRVTLERLEPLQDPIGDVHDIDVRLARLAEFAARCSPRERQDILALTKRVEASRLQKAHAVEAALEAWRDSRAGPRLTRLLAA